MQWLKGNKGGGIESSEEVRWGKINDNYSLHFAMLLSLGALC